MFEEALSLLSICSSMNSWLTHTVLFLLLNLMIGTIAFTSGFTSHKPSHHNNNLNNINNNINNHELHQQQQQPTYHYQQQFQQHQQQPQLISRSSSVLQRLKSINFNNLYSFYTHPPTTHYQSPQPEPESRPEPEPEPSPVSVEKEEEEEDGGEGPTMEEIYSRIKQGNQVSHYGRQNSDTKPSGGEIPVKLPQKMKKSASVKSAFNHFHFQPQNHGNNNGNDNVGVVKKATLVKKVEEERESGGVNASIKEEREEEGVEVESSVDAKADDFINKFKKQLQLQRNDSILRYKNMISRISAK